MAYILNIETATTVCSVSISEDNTLLATKEIDEGFTHSENLHVFIKELLQLTKLKPNNLNAIAVSKGPGSYTGLRIGVSSAKGLCYALNIPLISINTLQVMANSNFIKDKTSYYCPMLDARRMEVYTTVFDCNLNEVLPTEALVINEQSIEKYKEFPFIFFLGDGMPKCRDILSNLTNANFINNINPSAQSMVNLSYKKFKEKQFEDVAYFEPFYLKDFITVAKNQNK